MKCLEEILGRFIYSDPSKLKAAPEMRAAVLLLLNACIEMGSSMCYRQRDDFLTPSVPNQPADGRSHPKADDIRSKIGLRKSVMD